MSKSSRLLLLLLSFVMPASAWGGSSGATAVSEGEGPATYAGSPSAAGPANTALAWETDPAACAAERCATDQNADGSLVCSRPAFTWLDGSLAIEQVPDDLITAAKVAFPYAGSSTEGGAADTGDSATNFFSIGTVNTARLGSGPADSTTFLRGDQTWATPAGGSPGGSDTHVQFKDGSSFGGDAGFTYNKTTDSFTLGGSITFGGSTISASGGVIDMGTGGGNVIKIHSGRATELAIPNAGNRNFYLRTIDLSVHNSFVFGSNSTISSGGDVNSSNDTSMSNCGAGIWCFGTGADNNSDGKVTARNYLAGGTASPTVAGSCGTSPTIAGKDGALKVTTGTGSPTSCVVTFSAAWTTAPVCTANAATTTTALNIATTTTTVTVSAAALTAGEIIHVLCMGY